MFGLAQTDQRSFSLKLLYVSPFKRRFRYRRLQNARHSVGYIMLSLRFSHGRHEGADVDYSRCRSTIARWSVLFVCILDA